MATNIIFLFNSAMLGFGLAMDAFSVSLANGFTHPHIKRRRRHEIAFVYAAFQFMMPVIGWFFVHYAEEMFNGFRPFIPWIALILLLIIGGKLLLEGIREKKCSENLSCDECTNTECPNHMGSGKSNLSNKVLILQGIATSIDALSVGFTISSYKVPQVLICALIIGMVTHVVCYIGLKLGIKFGTKLAGKAKILGGIVLIAIGIEIFFG